LLRRQVCIRHFQWDRDAADYAARIFIVTESIKFVIFALVLVEIFFIFFKSSGLAQLLLVEVFFGLEIIALLAGFTVVWLPCTVHDQSLRAHSDALACLSVLLLQLKNVATGLFLIFAEPFRTGSLCRVRDLVGFIERVSLSRTIMRRRDGCRIFIPNGVFADTHQTSGNARELRHYELLLRLHPATSADTMQHFLDDLRATLPKFAVDATQGSLPPLRVPSAVSDSAATVPYAGTPQNSSFTNNTRGLSSFRSSVGSRNGPGGDEDYQTVSVELHDMYVVKVSLEIDRDQFPTFEAAKTEVSRRGCSCEWVPRLDTDDMNVLPVLLAVQPGYRSTWRSSRVFSAFKSTRGRLLTPDCNVSKPPRYLFQLNTHRPVS
jgi:hypothetical protein